jgi:hypothetical protein
MEAKGKTRRTAVNSAGGSGSSLSWPRPMHADHPVNGASVRGGFSARDQDRSKPPLEIGFCYSIWCHQEGRALGENA